MKVLHNFTNSSFLAEVFDLTHKGLGLLKHPSGKIFFAKGVWPGDLAEFSFLPDDLSQKKITEAKLEKLVKPSKDRMAPVCSHQGIAAGECHGCPWMIADYSSQLVFKQKRIVRTLQRAKLDVAISVLQNIVPSDLVLGYRNRAQFKTNGEWLGYVSAEDKSAAPIAECPILNESMQNLLKGLLKKLPNRDWQPKAGQDWTFLDCDDDMSLDAVMPAQKRPFKQGHTSQNLKMRDWLKQRLQKLDRNLQVLELFCGSGNFTEALAELGFTNVVAVESDERAIFTLKQKKLPHVKAVLSDLYDAREFINLQKQIGKRDVLVLDPPRDGLQHKARFFKAFPDVQHIFYISCDPESFAADAVFLKTELGFTPCEITPIDLFPQTPHVELLAQFVR